MSLFDEFSVNAKTCAGKMSRKADAAVELSRLKLAENRVQREISRSLKLLGAKVYKAYNTDDMSPDLKDDVTSISDMYARLKAIRSQITSLKKAEFSSQNNNTAKATE